MTRARFHFYLSATKWRGLARRASTSLMNLSLALAENRGQQRGGR
jgi:hypothetical protein